MLQHNPELKSRIDQLWNKFWSGGISNPLSAIEQMTYLLFMKRLDELDLKQQADAEWTGEPYRSRFKGRWIAPEERSLPKAQQRPVDRQTLRWSQFRHLPAREMLQHVQNRVFPFLKDLNDADSHFSRHMQNAVFIIPKPSLLVEAVNTIDEIFTIMEKDAAKGQAFQDIQGDVYEYLLSEIASAGKNGQFRTPRHIIKLMAELVQPQLGHRIADPACGTGGFLLGAYQYIVTTLARQAGAKRLRADEDGFVRTPVAATLTQDVQDILQCSLHGYDIDNTMVRLGLMNLMMHGIAGPQLDYRDTLSKDHDETGQYDIIMANPPFKGSIDKTAINPHLQLATTKTELLFVETIYRMLRKGGSACVIVPQGVLFGSGKAFRQLRQLLLERCDLKAVISMPGGVFKPYAGVSTAILLFTKVWEQSDHMTRPATGHVWLYDMRSDGYSLDDKRSKLDGYGDLQEIVKAYRARNPKKDTDRSAQCFCVPHAEIKAHDYDLSISRYRQDVPDTAEYETPALIVQRLIEAEVGDMGAAAKRSGIQGGIVGELLELREMVGGIQ